MGARAGLEVQLGHTVVGGTVGPAESLGNVPRPAASVHIAHPHEDAVVRGVAVQGQVQPRRAEHLHVLRQRGRGEGDHVRPRFQLAVVDAARPGRHVVPAHRGGGIGGIVMKFDQPRLARAFGARLGKRAVHVRVQRPVDGFRRPARQAAPLVGAGDVHPDLRVPARAGFPEVAVEPGQCVRVGHLRGLDRRVEVGPRPHGQGDLGIVRRKRGVLLHRLVEENVAPPADQQGRDGDAGQHGRGAVRVPERVLEVVVGQPLGKPRAAPVQRGRRGIGGRGRAAERGRRPPARGDHLTQAAEPAGPLRLDRRAPAQEVGQRQGPAAADGPGEVVRPHQDNTRAQFGWRVLEQRPLRPAEVGAAQGGQPAVEPGLLPQPGHRVLGVRGFLGDRPERPGRAAGAPHALHHHVVPAPGQHPAVEQAFRHSPAVRRPDEHCAQRVAHRRVVVGHQDGAVSCGHFEAALDGVPVADRLQAHQLALDAVHGPGQPAGGSVLGHVFSFEPCPLLSHADPL